MSVVPMSLHSYTRSRICLNLLLHLTNAIYDPDWASEEDNNWHDWDKSYAAFDSTKKGQVNLAVKLKKLTLVWRKSGARTNFTQVALQKMLWSVKCRLFLNQWSYYLPAILVLPDKVCPFVSGTVGYNTLHWVPDRYLDSRHQPCCLLSEHWALPCFSKTGQTGRKC